MRGFVRAYLRIVESLQQIRTGQLAAHFLCLTLYTGDYNDAGLFGNPGGNGGSWNDRLRLNR